MSFRKILLDHLGCTNKWNEPILGPYWAILAPLKAQKGLENGPNGDDKWPKDEVETKVSKHDPGSLVVPKRMNIAHFEPHLGRSRPLSLGVPHLSLKSGRQCPFPHQLGPNI